MDDSIKRNIAKIGIFAALSWIGYKIISGIAADKSSKEIIKETVAPITNVAAEVKKITKKFLKGSPEAKAHMAAIRAKIKKKPATDSEVIKTNNLTGKEAEKVKAGKIGGDQTATKGEHKGHSTKKGLVQDQKKISKEVHEKHYRKNKVKKNLKIDSYADGGVVKETGLALVHKGEIIIPVKKEIIDVIKNHKLLKYKGKVINAYLVGSHAKGTPRDDSDIDIVLQIPKQKDYSEEDFTKLKRKAIQDYFVKHNITGKADNLHPNYKGKRVDVYFSYSELKEGESVKLLK